MWTEGLIYTLLNYEHVDIINATLFITIIYCFINIQIIRFTIRRYPFMVIVYVLIVLFAGVSQSKRNKVTGKTESRSYPSDSKSFSPTIQSSFEPTKIISFDQRIVHFPLTAASSIDSNKLSCLITPTKFVDFTKSKAYKQLWRRTHRGIHWLPPKPTASSRLT